MVCDIFGKVGVNAVQVPNSYGKRGELFVIENVSVFSCPLCRGSYLNCKNFNRILNHQTKSSKKLEISYNHLVYAKT